MATEFLITFSTIAVSVGGIGLVLIGLSHIGEPIERRRADRARREWVEKYGESGRR